MSSKENTQAGAAVKSKSPEEGPALSRDWDCLRHVQPDGTITYRDIQYGVSVQEAGHTVRFRRSEEERYCLLQLSPQGEVIRKLYPVRAIRAGQKKGWEL